MKRINKIFVLFLSAVIFSVSTGCARNTQTGKLEPDYDKIAEAAQETARYFGFEALKYLSENAPEKLEAAHADITALENILRKYADGEITVGELNQTVVEIFERVKAYFPKADNAITTWAAGWILGLSGILNMAIAAVPVQATKVITGLIDGLDTGLTQYDAWQASQVLISQGQP